MNKQLSIIIALLYSTITFSQIAPNTWKEYFAYNQTKQIIEINNSIVALTANGLFIYNTKNEELTKTTKIQGLSTVGLTTMAYKKEVSELIVGYGDGSIDIIKIPSLQIISIPTIANRSIYGSKAIRDICFENDTAFIATDFGIISMNMKTHDFIHTTILGSEGENVKVFDIDVDAATHTLYAASEKGIYTISTQKNLSDISLWTLISDISPSSNLITQLTYYNNGLYFLKQKLSSEDNDSLFLYKNNTVTIFADSIKTIQKIKTQNNSLIIIGSSIIIQYDNSNTILTTIDTSNVPFSDFF